MAGCELLCFFLFWKNPHWIVKQRRGYTWDHGIVFFQWTVGMQKLSLSAWRDAHPRNHKKRIMKQTKGLQHGGWEETSPSELFKWGPSISGYISWTCHIAMYLTVEFVHENHSPWLSQRKSVFFFLPWCGRCEQRVLRSPGRSSLAAQTQLSVSSRKMNLQRELPGSCE